MAPIATVPKPRYNPLTPLSASTVRATKTAPWMPGGVPGSTIRRVLMTESGYSAAITPEKSPAPFTKSSLLSNLSQSTSARAAIERNAKRTQNVRLTKAVQALLPPHITSAHNDVE
eukprot:CAMPEP_0198210388 /NCGR_PEP_ID=MMETSP1445-20131203/20073_1 /TAXON_ID=36898 /ORGANISM="Pyramimonas sp., Strain CCMP2087" /LENGTH=115 /DNA_ID=CAMNT_0043884433 /DNA_START=324 /DNA_END=671 /DNA_ORIENTATION=-